MKALQALYAWIKSLLFGHQTDENGGPGGGHGPH